ncbi:MAG: hypothetical protein R3C03_03345 [Pirellulaceae bacterium]
MFVCIEQIAQRICPLSSFSWHSAVVIGTYRISCTGSELREPVTKRRIWIDD